MPGMQPQPAPPTPTFASTGPQGHRGRMRARLLLRGPDGLADYELLEMLLFLGIPRRDTAPIAKAAINLFGSLPAALDASPAALRRAGTEPPGNNGAVPAIFALVRESARRLQRADSRHRPVLDGTDRLIAHLDLPSRFRHPPHIAALLLNNRNQLLAEHRHADDATPTHVARDIARHAVAVHATALVLATCRPAAPPAISDRDAEITGHVLRAARVLSVTLHDHWIFGTGGAHVTLKRAGLL